VADIGQGSFYNAVEHILQYIMGSLSLAARAILTSVKGTHRTNRCVRIRGLVCVVCCSVCCGVCCSVCCRVLLCTSYACVRVAYCGVVCGVVRCSVCRSACCSVWSSVWCSVLQCVAVCCSVVQRSAACESMLQRVAHTTTHTHECVTCRVG